MTIVEPTCEDFLEDVGVGEDQDPHGLDDHDLNEELRSLNDLDIPEFPSGRGDQEDDIENDFDSDLMT